MRYEDWDIILFPGNSLVPIQEFKTACYIAHDDYGRPLPTLTCFIASLPPTTPFRISVHSWTKPKPTSIIESRRKQHQRVVHTARVMIDGARVFHEYYEENQRWPQEIEHEKPFVGFADQQTRQPKSALQFPPFHRNLLLQDSWDVRESNGQIKVVMSERLLNRSSSPGELEFGALNDICCFAFQHAPREILEQAGLCWPLRNPLYLPPVSNSRPSRSDPPMSYGRLPSLAPDSRAQSPVSRYTDFQRREPPESFSREVTGLEPGRSGLGPFQAPKPDSSDRQFVMTLRDDQFGRLMEALSPISRDRHASLNTRKHQPTYPPSAASQIHPARLSQMNMNVPGMFNTKPSSAAMARTASYSDIPKFPPAHTLRAHLHPSADSAKENIDPRGAPTPRGMNSPFRLSPPPYRSERSTKGPPSMYSSLDRSEHAYKENEVLIKSSPLPVPAPVNSIRSRKEGLGLGMGMASPAAPAAAQSAADFQPGSQLDKMMFAEATTVLDDECRVSPTKSKGKLPARRSPETREDRDTRDGRDEGRKSPFRPGHGGGVGSLGRIEKRLWSALGDELRGYDIPVADMGPGGADEFPPLPDFGARTGEDAEKGKRKRGTTMGGERGKSPERKVLREVDGNGNGNGDGNRGV